jgi:hypothetical protein
MADSDLLPDTYQSLLQALKQRIRDSLVRTVALFPHGSICDGFRAHN